MFPWTEVIAIPGTGSHTRSSDWDQPSSPLFRFFRQYGIRQRNEKDAKRRYRWSGALDGIDKDDETWDASGCALYHAVVPPYGDGLPAIPPEQTFLITHSHAGNVAMIACGVYGLKVEALITVGMPIRGGRMAPIYEAAAKNIKRHVHLHSNWRDYWQFGGGLFDGQWGVHREHPFAQNFRMPGGHGDVLRKPELFSRWIDDGWLAAFLGREVQRVTSA